MINIIYYGYENDEEIWFESDYLIEKFNYYRKRKNNKIGIDGDALKNDLMKND